MSEASPPATGHPPIFELRVYHAMPGRFYDLIARFQTQSVRFWKRHGIRCVGMWQTLVGESSSDVTYMFVWQSMDERFAKFGALGSDAEFLKERAESERDGPLYSSVTNQFLTEIPLDL